jgi:PAS domain-containing protein
VKPTEPLPLFHSWPILDSDRHFDLGHLVDGDAAATLSAVDDAFLARHSIGRWECDLKDSRLTWSDAVYDLFGLPRGTDLSRAATVAQYSEDSRAAMERLRAYAIQHHRGFTLDAQIRATDGTPRWMRLIAAPVCVGNRAIRLVGLKRELSPRH